MGRSSHSHCVWVFFYSKAKASGQDIDHLDFKIVVEPKDSSSFTVILVASSRQEKAAWTSDISQVGQTRQGGDVGAQSPGAERPPRDSPRQAAAMALGTRNEHLAFAVRLRLCCLPVGWACGAPLGLAPSGCSGPAGG